MAQLSDINKGKLDRILIKLSETDKILNDIGKLEYRNKLTQLQSYIKAAEVKVGNMGKRLENIQKITMNEEEIEILFSISGVIDYISTMIENIERRNPLEEELR